MIKQIQNPSSPIFKSPNIRSNLETEALFGEKVKILNKKGIWTFCKLLTDNYLGWIKTKDLNKQFLTTHRVISFRSFIYAKPEIKSKVINYLPMGSKISCDSYDQNWYKIYINNQNNIGFIPSMDVVKKNHQVNDWVSSIEKLEGTPYKWGGRDTIGIDCSSLIQLGIQTKGIKFPRNSEDQNKFCNKNIELINISRGDLVFWDGHVGTMVNKKNLLHANAYFMKVVVEPLMHVINRIGANKKFEIKNF